MIHSQEEKVIVVESAITVETSVTNSISVDTLGYDYLVLESYLPKATAAGSADKWLAATLGHATTTHISNATTITGATGTTNPTATASQFVLANNQDTTFGSVLRFQVNLAPLERYIHITRMATASHSLSSTVARLSGGDATPNTKAEQGVNSLCSV